MSDKNTQEIKDCIDQVVEHFYARATSDQLIGYQFRKIAQLEGLAPSHPLAPPLEAFAHHLPRISAFWRIQLGVAQTGDLKQQFDLIHVHQALKLNRGELGRWLHLFEQTLEAPELALPAYIKTAFREKLAQFEKIFVKKLWP